MDPSFGNACGVATFPLEGRLPLDLQLPRKSKRKRHPTDIPKQPSPECGGNPPRGVRGRLIQHDSGRPQGEDGVCPERGRVRR